MNTIGLTRHAAVCAALISTVSGQGFNLTGLDPDALPEVSPDLKVTVFAKEPMVRNVGALAFDRKGRLFAAYGRQYRNPTPESPTESILLVVDENGDGVADRSKEFATGFNSIQGMAWRGRDLWVANAPDLTIVRDLDEDDEADEYVLVFSGLGTLEHGLHGLVWAPDGKLYMSKGDTPVDPGAPRPFRDLSDVPADPGTPDEQPLRVFKKGEYKKTYLLPMDGHTVGGVLRCEDLGKNLEVFCRGLRNPWDMTFDDEFNWLATDNDDVGGDRIVMPIYGAHFGSRHPWSNSWTGEDHPPTVPISGPLFEGSGVGIVYYTAQHLPERFRNAFLLGDWQLTQMYIVRPKWEGSLLADRSTELESFANPGPKKAVFRPTDVEVGPDGALYVGGWGSTYGFTEKSEGRIFRFTNPSKPLLKTPDRLAGPSARAMKDWTINELVEAFDLPVVTWRVDAQDELVRRGTAIRAELVSLLQRGKLSRAQETWVIWALGRIAPEDQAIEEFFIKQANSAEFNNRQVQALRILGERAHNKWLAGSYAPLPQVVNASLDHPAPRIRFEAVQAIWKGRQTNSISLLKEILAKETDRLTFYSAWRTIQELLPAEERARLLTDSRTGVRLGAMLGALEAGELDVKTVSSLSKDADAMISRLATDWLAKSGHGLETPQQVLEQLERLKGRHVNYKLRVNLLRLLEPMKIQGRDWEIIHGVWWRPYFPNVPVDEIVPEEKAEEIATALAAMLADERSLPVFWDALSHKYPKVREAAVTLFPRQGEKGRALLLEKLPAASLEQKELAILALRGFDWKRDQVKPREGWVKAMTETFEKSDNGAVKAALLDIFGELSQKTWRDAGLAREQAVAVAKIAAGDPDPQVHRRVPAVAAALGEEITVTAKFEPATIENTLGLVPKGNPARGRELFFKPGGISCAGCHQANGSGSAFGPDLSDVASRADARGLLEAILDPNVNIIEGYRASNIVMKDETEYFGVVLNETGNELTVVQSDGRPVTLRKADIANRTGSNSSIMPSNFGELISKQDLADVVAWLLTLRKTQTALK